MGTKSHLFFNLACGSMKKVVFWTYLIYTPAPWNDIFTVTSLGSLIAYLLEALCKSAGVLAWGPGLIPGEWSCQNLLLYVREAIKIKNPLKSGILPNPVYPPLPPQNSGMYFFYDSRFQNLPPPSYFFWNLYFLHNSRFRLYNIFFLIERLAQTQSPKHKSEKAWAKAFH